MDGGDPPPATAPVKARKRGNNVQEPGDPLNVQLERYVLKPVAVERTTNSFFAAIAKQTVDATTERADRPLDAWRLRREILQILEIEKKLRKFFNKDLKIDDAKNILAGENWDRKYEKLAVNALHHIGIHVVILVDNLKPLMSTMAQEIKLNTDIAIIRHDAGHYSATERILGEEIQPAKLKRPWKSTITRLDSVTQVRDMVPIVMKNDETMGKAVEQVPSNRKLVAGHGKGDSIFNCVIIQLPYVMTTSQLRRKVCDALNDQREAFKALMHQMDDLIEYDSMVTNLRKSGFYTNAAADILIYAIHAVLEERIVILQDNSSPFIVGENIPATEYNIFLIKNNVNSENHYDAAVTKTLSAPNHQIDEYGKKVPEPIAGKGSRKKTQARIPGVITRQMPSNRRYEPLPINNESLFYAITMQLKVPMTTINLRHQACDLIERDKERLEDIINEEKGSFESQLDCLRQQNGFIAELMDAMIEKIQTIVQHKIVILRGYADPKEIGEEKDPNETIYIAQKQDNPISQYDAVLVKRKRYTQLAVMRMEAEQFHKEIHQAFSGADIFSSIPASPIPLDDQNRQSIDNQLRRLGRVEVEIAKSGNCMFEAVAYQLGNMTADELRQRACDEAAKLKRDDHIRGFVDASDNEYDRLVNRMRKDGEWANDLGDVMPEFIHRVINQPMVLILPNRPAQTFPAGLNPIPDDAVVVTLDQAHYSSTRRVRDDEPITSTPIASRHKPPLTTPSLTQPSGGMVVLHEEFTSSQPPNVPPISPAVSKSWGSALEQLADYGLVPVEVPPDDDSFFQSIAKVIEGIDVDIGDGEAPLDAYDLREKAAAKIRENRRYGVYARTPENWQEIAQFIRHANMWNYKLEEFIVNIMFDIGFKVFVFSDNVPPVTNRFAKNRITVDGSIILYRKGNFYNATAPSNIAGQELN